MYTNRELATMHSIYGLTGGNGLQARSLHQERYPTCRCPNRKTFERIHRRLCEHGSLAYLSGNKGRPKNTARKVEEEILDIFDKKKNPRINTRRIGIQLNIGHASVWRLLHEQQLHLLGLGQIEQS